VLGRKFVLGRRALSRRKTLAPHVPSLMLGYPIQRRE
jgi:hypothetical protein